MKRQALMAAVAAVALAGCSAAGDDAARPAKVSEAEAQAALESARKAWASGDAATIDAIYAEDVTGSTSPRPPEPRRARR